MAYREVGHLSLSGGLVGRGLKRRNYLDRLSSVLDWGRSRFICPGIIPRAMGARRIRR